MHIYSENANFFDINRYVSIVQVQLQLEFSYGCSSGMVVELALIKM